MLEISRNNKGKNIFISSNFFCVKLIIKGMSFKYDWYQNDEKVVVTVLLKNAAEKNYKCEITEDSVHLTADNYELKLELLNPVNPEKSNYRATQFKVEINLIKRDFGKWSTLERKIHEVEEVKPATKKKKPEDWNKLAKEIEKTEDKDEVSSSYFFTVSIFIINVLL